MKKDQLLWGLGAIALAFTYIAAVNATVPGYDLLGNPTGRAVCGGVWNPADWFKYCDAALPQRLGVMAVGAAIFLVCAYFAKKFEASGHHEVLQDTRDDSYWCLNCSFHSSSVEDARNHKMVVLSDAATATRGPGSSQATGNAYGFGPSAAASPTPPVRQPLVTPPPAEFKTCPDCAEQVRAAARKCRFCGRMFAEASASQ